MRARTYLSLIIVGVVAAALPASAPAATVRMAGAGTIAYSDGTGSDGDPEESYVTVELIGTKTSGSYLFEEDGADSFRAGSGCSQPLIDGPVSCPAKPVTGITFSFGSGDDTLDATYVDQPVTIPITAQGGGGDDDFAGGDGNDTLDGGTDEFGDLIAGGLGDDTLDGGAGGNPVTGTGEDQLEGEEGNDLLLGGDGIDDLDGGEGDDRLFGGNHDDLVDGDLGNDAVDGGAGADELAGGAGDDSLLANDGVVDQVDCGTGTNDSAQTDVGTVKDVTAADCERINGSGPPVVDPPDDPPASGKARLEMSQGRVIYTSGDGSSNDVSVFGGDPYVFVTDLGATIDVPLAGGCVSFTSHVGYCPLPANGLTIDVGDGDDRVSSSLAEPVLLKGGAGKDSLTGGSDSDTIEGGDGDDLLAGGGGTTGDAADTITGGSGADSVSYASYTLPVRANLAGGTAGGFVKGKSERDELDTVESLIGGTGADILKGDTGANTIFGGAGNDKLYGYDGNDTIDGGIGDDLLNGMKGNDRLDMRDTRNPGGTLDLSANGKDRLNGSSGIDALNGLDAFIDRLNCGSDADIALTNVTIDKTRRDSVGRSCEIKSNP